MSSEENSNDPESIANKPPVPPRDDLVQKAGEFLSRGNVQRSPDDMKIAFLKKKGLSDAEIDLAFKKCEVILQNKGYVPNLNYAAPIQYPYNQLSFSTSRRWILIRDIANGVVLLAGFLYGVYWCYKRYIWRQFFGNPSRKKPSTEERLSFMEEKLSMICHNLDSLKESVENKSAIMREINDVKVEVTSLKKLLLSRKQFPVLSATSPLSIPSWQIAGTTEEKDEEGAGTNGSDSSLEMIKE